MSQLIEGDIGELANQPKVFISHNNMLSRKDRDLKEFKKAFASCSQNILLKKVFEMSTKQKAAVILQAIITKTLSLTSESRRLEIGESTNTIMIGPISKAHRVISKFGIELSESTFEQLFSCFCATDNIEIRRISRLSNTILKKEQFESTYMSTESELGWNALSISDCCTSMSKTIKTGLNTKGDQNDCRVEEFRKNSERIIGKRIIGPSGFKNRILYILILFCIVLGIQIIRSSNLVIDFFEDNEEIQHLLKGLLSITQFAALLDKREMSRMRLVNSTEFINYEYESSQIRECFILMGKINQAHILHDSVKAISPIIYSILSTGQFNYLYREELRDLLKNGIESTSNDYSDSRLLLSMSTNQETIKIYMETMEHILQDIDIVKSQSVLVVILAFCCFFSFILYFLVSKNSMLNSFNSLISCLGGFRNDDINTMLEISKKEILRANNKRHESLTDLLQFKSKNDNSGLKKEPNSKSKTVRSLKGITFKSTNKSESKPGAHKRISSKAIRSKKMNSKSLFSELWLVILISLIILVPSVVYFFTFNSFLEEILEYAELKTEAGRLSLTIAVQVVGHYNSLVIENSNYTYSSELISITNKITSSRESNSLPGPLIEVLSKKGDINRNLCDDFENETKALSFECRKITPDGRTSLPLGFNRIFRFVDLLWDNLQLQKGTQYLKDNFEEFLIVDKLSIIVMTSLRELSDSIEKYSVGFREELHNIGSIFLGSFYLIMVSGVLLIECTVFRKLARDIRNLEIAIFIPPTEMILNNGNTKGLFNWEIRRRNK